MAFSHEILLQAWARSGAHCECQREGHGHEGRCGHALLWTLRGSTSTAGGWDAVHRTSWGTDVLAECMIICTECQKPQVVQVR